MKRVLVALPTSWDVKQLSLCQESWADRYQVVLDPTDENELRWDFDPIAHAEGLIEEHGGKTDGVFSASDYPGAVVAAAVATGLGLPGSRPEAVVHAAHKYHSRIAQAAAAPEAVPAFDLLDPGRIAAPSVGFPCFVKPVKGAFSRFARRIDTVNELIQFLRQPAVGEFNQYYLMMFDRMVEHYTELRHGRGWFLAEALLSGEQTTVEGWVHGGQVEVFGIVDSIMHPGTNSFLRFDYPSSLPTEVQSRMGDVVRRVIAKLGLGDGLFNVEMVWDAAQDRVWIIEINPRMCGQFADLHLHVDGISTIELALDLAAGQEPRFTRGGGDFACAASYPLRIFEPVEVLRAPSAQEVLAMEAHHREAMIWNECKAGDRLADFAKEDGASHRYAVINLAGHDVADRERRFEEMRGALDWRFASLPEKF